MQLAACIKLASQALNANPDDGVTQVGSRLYARAGSRLLVIDDVYLWCVSMIHLLGHAGFMAAAFSPDAKLSAMGRAVVVLRISPDGASLEQFFATNRKTDELLAVKPKGKRHAINTDDAIKLKPSFGDKKGKRPGYAAAGSEAARA